MARLEELICEASSHLAQGNSEEAIRKYNHALVINGRSESKSALIYGALGFAYYSIGQFEKAERAYKCALELSPGDTTIINRLAEAYLEQKKFAEASNEQTRILETNPEDIRARVGLGHSYMGMRRYDKAIEAYLAAIKQGLRATVTLGWRHLFSKKRNDRRIQVEDRVIEKIDIKRAYLGLIKAHQKKGEPAKSRKYILQSKLFGLKTAVADLLLSLKP
jgi:tetratricopeptide (TPR) repeat protein